MSACLRERKSENVWAGQRWRGGDSAAGDRSGEWRRHAGGPRKVDFPRDGERPPTVSITLDLGGWVRKYTGPIGALLCPVFVSIIVVCSSPRWGTSLPGQEI